MSARPSSDTVVKSVRKLFKENPMGVLVVAVLVFVALGALARTMRPQRSASGWRTPAASVPSAARLFQGLEEVPILEQESVRASYVNARVEWPVVVEDITEGESRQRVVYELVGRDPSNEEIEILALDFGGTDIALLKRIRRGQDIRLSGRIDEVDRNFVVLTEAKITSQVP